VRSSELANTLESVVAITANSKNDARLLSDIF
jgi:hypothetical protein